MSTASLFFAGKRKVGVSALALDGGGLARRAAGVHGVFGIGSHAYLLTETSVHRRRGGGRSGDWEVLSNSCFARETVKGLYVLLLDEISHRKIGGRSRTSHSYGAALRWFPRPHMETQLRWRRQDVDAVSPRELDGLSLFARFYL